MLQGDQYLLKDGFSSGYGFDGLVVGLLARGSVVGVIAAALLFGFLRSGGINMEMVAGVPTALVMVIQGLIVVTLAAPRFSSGGAHDLGAVRRFPRLVAAARGAAATRRHRRTRERARRRAQYEHRGHDADRRLCRRGRLLGDRQPGARPC